MEYDPADYRKLVVKQYPPRALRETPEGRYWRRFKTPVLARQVISKQERAFDLSRACESQLSGESGYLAVGRAPAFCDCCF